MKKYIILSIVLGILIATCSIVFFENKSNKLGLTGEEKEFINHNKDTIFFMGYYVTPSQKLVIDKLCDKISDDIGLNIEPFEGTWEENLKNLQSGKLPILANMNITEDRLEYTFFTNLLKDLPIGLYSNYKNKIGSYDAIQGKTIGIEKNVCLINDFKIKFPKIKFNEKYYNNLNELKKALSDGEIDGFISSKSYSEDLKFYYFFHIESLSEKNNYIGVSKNYPLLYSVLNKEVDALIDMEWEKELRDLVNFDIETKFIALTEEEKEYIQKKEVAMIGLPKEYSYYAYGEPYNLQGIIPAFFNKIEILTNIEFAYIQDDYENLIHREDIDIIVSSENLPFVSTAPIFSNNLIAVSNEKRNMINENYELERYTIGTVNDTIFINHMKKIMPYIDIKIYKTYNKLYQELEEKNIDYAILPERLFEKKQSKADLVNSGFVGKRFHYIYSKKNREPLINIINKCLPRINMDHLIDKELSHLIHEEKRLDHILILPIVLLIIMGSMIQLVIKRKDMREKLLYFDEETMLHNELWLKNKLKVNYGDYIYFLVKPCNLNLILKTYGMNAYRKSLRVMIKAFKDNIKKNEYVIKLQNNQILIIKKQMLEKDRIAYMNKLTTLFNRKSTICGIHFGYQMYVVGLKPENKSYQYEQLLKELETGMHYAEYIEDIVDYTYDIYCKYQEKISYDAQLASAIINEEVSLTLNRIINTQEQLYGYDVSCSAMTDEWGEVSFVNLKRSVKRLGLETIFDKIVFKKLFEFIQDSSDAYMKIFIEVSKKTLESNSFFEWLIEKLEFLEGIQLFIKIDIDSYERLVENFEYIGHEQLKFVLSDFEQTLVESTLVKEYDISLVEINGSLFSDLERNKEMIDFIVFFSRKYNKKIITTSIKTNYQYQMVKEYDIDYYVDEFRRNKNESINSRG